MGWSIGSSRGLEDARQEFGKLADLWQSLQEYPEDLPHQPHVPPLGPHLRTRIIASEIQQFSAHAAFLAGSDLC